MSQTDISLTPAEVDAAVRDADVVLFVVDAREGVTALDREIAEGLRRRAVQRPRRLVRQQHLERLPPHVRVRWLGQRQDVPAILQAADVLAHPSRYEGFGLQIVDAMAAGTPVVCSRCGSMPEVSGGAAVLLDPDDVEGWADALRSVLADSDSTDEKQLQSIPFDVARQLQIAPKDLFRTFYEVVFGQERGPRFGTFVQLVGKQKALSLLHDAINR